MPRRSRYVIPGIPMHVTQRGNNGMACFLDDQDRAMYLHTLRQACEKHELAVHSFVLMGNHVHMLVTPSNEDSPGKCMHLLGTTYARYFNKRHERTGTLWDSRFFSCLVQTDRYFFAASCYIELNPVRAGIVCSPADFVWSSFRGNALGCRIELLTPHPVYEALGQTHDARLKAYSLLFEKGLSDEDLALIRLVTRKRHVLGDSAFKTFVEKQLNITLPSLQQGGDRKPRDQGDGLLDL